MVLYSYLLKNFPVCFDPYKGFSVVSEAEVDVFLEFLCFLYDPLDVGNLISGSSAFSKSIFYIWKFSVRKLLKPSLKDFENYLDSMWTEHNCVVVLTFLPLPFSGTRMKTILFQYCGHCWVFQICWHLEHSNLTASSFKIWNSSTVDEIAPSSPLTLFLVISPKAHLTSYSRMSGSRWMITPMWLSGSLRPF